MYKNINFSDISDKEKIQLKKRITNSIYSDINKKRYLKYATTVVAASIIMLFSIRTFNTITNNSPVEVFAKNTTNKKIKDLKNVTLFLTNDKNIEIIEKKPKIEYSNNGLEIVIDASKLVNQSSVKNRDLVFNTLLVPRGKKSEIILADGSKIWLNSDSKLVYPITFSGERREVYLEGEGIFEVNHNKNQPFIVKSKDHEIKVLGTVFNVSNYANDESIKTTLKSGSIEINFKNNSFINSSKSVKITPGTIAVYNKTEKKLVTNKVAVEKYFSWRKDVFIFKKNSLSTVMKKISRRYNVEIHIENNDLANESFSGYLNLKEDVREVLNIVQEITGFEYTFQNDAIIIR